MRGDVDREPVPGGLGDRVEHWPVVASEVVHQTGRVISVRKDVVAPPHGGPEFTRDVVVHPGAVAIVALDEDDQVLLVAQYRHPVGYRLLEIPAGLLDVPDEPMNGAAARELYEEGHVRATDWRILADVFATPGMSTESIRIYLARELTSVAEAQRHNGDDEEADMPVVWAPLSDVVDAILAGRIHNGITCTALLATWAALNGEGYDALRKVDTTEQLW